MIPRKVVKGCIAKLSRRERDWLRQQKRSVKNYTLSELVRTSPSCRDITRQFFFFLIKLKFIYITPSYL